jgi:flagellar hook-basal body complex protein FliE
MKAFKKHIIPFVQLVDSWNRGQQKNPHLSETVNEAIKPQGYSQLNTMAKHATIYLRDLSKALRKQDDSAVLREVHFLAAQFTTMEKMLKDKKWNAKYNESVNEVDISKIRNQMNKETAKIRHSYEMMRKYSGDDVKKANHWKDVGNKAKDRMNALQDRINAARKKESVNEARTINVEPNWEGMWRFFKRMAKTNPRDWKRMERTLGSDWKKIDKMAQQKGWKSESVNEAVEPQGNMAKIAKVVKDKQATKLSGVMIDMQSANLLMKLWDAVSDKDKEKMNKLNAKMLTTVIKRLWSRVNLKLPV